MVTKNGTNYNDNGTVQNNVYYPILTGTDGNDNIYGLAGNDIINGGAGNDNLYGDGGNDLIRGGDGNDYLFGGDGNDTLIGDRGADRFLGGAGNDLLIWNNGDGSDRISGETGYDTVQVNGGPVGDNFRLQRDAQGKAIFDRLNPGPFTLTVDTAEKFEINGLGGDDILYVNSLAGTGVSLVQFTGGAGNDLLNGSGTETSLLGYGNDGNDTLIGGSGIDNLYGDAGNDILQGGNGGDYLFGGDGNDEVEGNKGNDTMIGGAGNDTLEWDDGDGSDRISGNAGTDTVDVDGSLTQGDQFVLGQQGNLAIFDRVNLGPFKLTVDTAEQFSVSGEGGNDSLDVNNLSYTGVNLVSFFGGAGNDTLDGSDSTTRLYGTGDAGDDLLIGGSRHDTLYGGAGKDTLYGGAGNDYIVGGYGADVLYGDGGADKFVFNYVSEGIDIIKDFQTNWSQPSLGDKIEISKVGFGASSTNQFKYDSYTGALSFLGNQFAIIENKPAGFSTTTDIVLV